RSSVLVDWVLSSMEELPLPGALSLLPRLATILSGAAQARAVRAAIASVGLGYHPNLGIKEKDLFATLVSMAGPEDTLRAWKKFTDSSSRQVVASRLGDFGPEVVWPVLLTGSWHVRPSGFERPDRAFNTLRTLRPLLCALGGPAAITEAAHALVDVRGWWR